MRARRGSPFDSAERSAILDRFRTAWQAREAASDAADEAAAELTRQEMAAAAVAYVDAVPILPLSRSPLTDSLFQTSLDTFGIDGLWWAYEYDYRPYVEPPRDLFAWTGAMKLDGAIPTWSLKTLIGPEVPFVLPRILAHPALTAVVSSVLVGEHIGFPIVYFADPQPPDLERVDDWGHGFHSYVRPDGTPASAHSIEDDGEKDFELAPWLDRGRLLWIAPGDESLTLRHGTDGCPYLDLPGEHRRRYVQTGRTWLA